MKILKKEDTKLRGGGGVTRGSGVRSGVGG